MKESTRRFLELMDKQNARVAELEAENESGIDPIRLERETERREKWGALRAREHPRSHPKRTDQMFG